MKYIDLILLMLINTMNLVKHYRNQKLYNIIATIYDKKSEKYVLYQQMYKSDNSELQEYQYWIRPFDMFHENVNHDGKMVPRFTKLYNFY